MSAYEFGLVEKNTDSEMFLPCFGVTERKTYSKACGITTVLSYHRDANNSAHAGIPALCTLTWQFFGVKTFCFGMLQHNSTFIWFWLSLISLSEHSAGQENSEMVFSNIF